MAMPKPRSVVTRHQCAEFMDHVALHGAAITVAHSGFGYDYKQIYEAIMKRAKDPDVDDLVWRGYYGGRMQEADKY